jgi:hypothetical protein
MSQFKEKVDTIVAQMEPQEDGTWKLPDTVLEGLDEATSYAVTQERRFRDTQGAYTKSQQETKRQKAINQGLTQHLVDNATTHLTKAQKADLDELKVRDPEAWREQLNVHETESKTLLKTTLDGIEQAGSNKSELEVRTEKMAAWSESTGLTLNDEVIANELPPKYLKDLEAKKITFDEFLEVSSKFLKADKVILGATDDGERSGPPMSLSDAPGGTEPTTLAQQSDLDKSYENTIF